MTSPIKEGRFNDGPLQLSSEKSRQHRFFSKDPLLIPGSEVILKAEYAIQTESRCYMVKKLTPKQQRFCDEYLVDLNMAKAAIRAGYSKKTAYSIGSENLTKPEIQAYLQERMKARQERTEITQDYVLQTIKETVDRCRQVRPVTDRQGNHIMVETEDGSLVPGFSFDAGSVLRGCELLGKHLGMFGSKFELTGKDGGPIEFTDVERAHRIAAILDAARARGTGQATGTAAGGE